MVRYPHEPPRDFCDGVGDEVMVVLESAREELGVVEVERFPAGLPDGKIGSLPFLGLRQGGGRGGAIQGKEGIKFCCVA